MAVTDLVRTARGLTASGSRRTQSGATAGTGSQNWIHAYRVTLVVGDAVGAVAVAGLAIAGSGFEQPVVAGPLDRNRDVTEDDAELVQGDRDVHILVGVDADHDSVVMKRGPHESLGWARRRGATTAPGSRTTGSVSSMPTIVACGQLRTHGNQFSLYVGGWQRNCEADWQSCEEAEEPTTAVH